MNSGKLRFFYIRKKKGSYPHYNMEVSYIFGMNKEFSRYYVRIIDPVYLNLSISKYVIITDTQIVKTLIDKH